jgi:hypothetical protein
MILGESHVVPNGSPFYSSREVRRWMAGVAHPDRPLVNALIPNSCKELRIKTLQMQSVGSLIAAISVGLMDAPAGERTVSRRSGTAP